MNNVINGINTLSDYANNILDVSINVRLSNINLDKIPEIKDYYTGGHPEKASLFWANKKGIPELIRQMNGSPAVASGGEITGIADAVYSTSQQEMKLTRQQNALLQAILKREEINMCGLFNAMIDENTNYKKMYVESAMA